MTEDTHFKKGKNTCLRHMGRVLLAHKIDSVDTFENALETLVSKLFPEIYSIRSWIGEARKNYTTKRLIKVDKERLRTHPMMYSATENDFVNLTNTLQGFVETYFAIVFVFKVEVRA